MEIKRRVDLAKYFAKLGFKFGAEIGVAGARFSEVICKVNPGLRLYCIDPWMKYRGNRRGGLQEQHDRNLALAIERLKPYDAKLMKMKSMEAIPHFNDGDLDFVYIDGHHDFDYVMMDIIEWSKKVRKGGIVSGHDYYNFKNSGVIEAVDVYVKMHGLELHLTDKNVDYGEVSWWFVKK